MPDRVLVPLGDMIARTGLLEPADWGGTLAVNEGGRQYRTRNVEALKGLAV